jgi:bacterioferritin-associated ferredoxin
VILCICNAVTDREVDDVIRRGANSVDAVTQMCGAGGDCGTCVEAIENRLSCSSKAQNTASRAKDCGRSQPALASAAP